MPLGNSPYTNVLKHGVLCNPKAAFFGFGDETQTKAFSSLRLNNWVYLDDWANSDMAFGSYAPNNVVSNSYDQSTRSGYLNNILIASVASTGHNLIMASHQGSFLGCANPYFNDYYMKGSLYSVVIATAVLSNSDRSILGGCMKGWS